MIAKPLDGCSVLLLEDEYFQAMESRAFLERAGAKVVGPAACEKDVHRLLKASPVDTAILDINLGKGASFEVARQLREAHVPFMFVTGYDQTVVPADFADVPRIEKPANGKRVVEQLTRLLNSRT